MKPTKTTGSRLPLTGLLAKMPWVKVSRRSIPSSAAEAEAVYGVRTSDEIVQASRHAPDGSRP